MHQDNRIKLALLLPAVLWVLCFTIFPLVYGVGLSFFNVKIGRPDTFVGFENYVHFFKDDVGRKSALITLIFVCVSVTVQMIVGMGLAVLLSRDMPLRSTLRTTITMPLFATPVAVGYLFLTIFYEKGGLVNGLLPQFTASSLEEAQQMVEWVKSLPGELRGTAYMHEDGTARMKVILPWLSRPRWALASIILVDIWQWTPFCFLIFLASLQGIPRESYEAAMLETKSGWQVFRHVTLPMMQPTIILVLLLRLTEAFKVFDIPYTLTGGGPANATKMLSFYAYEAWREARNIGYTCSVAVMLFITVLIALMILFKRTRQIYE